MGKYKRGYQVIVNAGNAIVFKDLTKTIRAVKILKEDMEDEDGPIWYHDPDEKWDRIADADTVFEKRSDCHTATEAALREARETVYREIDNLKGDYKDALKTLKRLDTMLADCDGANPVDKKIIAKYTPSLSDIDL